MKPVYVCPSCQQETYGQFVDVYHDYGGQPVRPESPQTSRHCGLCGATIVFSVVEHVSGANELAELCREIW